MFAETLPKACKLIRMQFCVDTDMSVEILGNHLDQIKHKVVSWINAFPLWKAQAFPLQCKE